MEDFKAYWRTWLWAGATRRIITVNVIVWLVVGLCSLIGRDAWAIAWLPLPSSPRLFLSRPWTLISYFWLQLDFLHLLCNMLWFLLFGQMIEHAWGSRRLAALYIGGGVAGGAAFVLSNLISMGAHPIMLGASCAVAAVIGAAMAAMPRWRLSLFLLGEVQVRWIALVAIAMLLLSSLSPYVAVAHLAGLGYGVAAALARKRRLLTPASFVRRQPAATRPAHATDEERLDQLLDIVHRSGYASLSAAQRQELFDLSQRLRR